MTLASGATLGPYEILSPLGAGGMGEVYRARDTKLDRDVAIKVLPETFARDPERVARFQREAKVLASLNHPNIAAIYGFETESGEAPSIDDSSRRLKPAAQGGPAARAGSNLHFLILELVEGETLAERLRGGALAVNEALEVCKQIAEALEAAHERGVIHRDLKPANVKVTPDGVVKVLDFGLAKAFAGDTSGAALADSPTITMEHTRPGVVLGTAAYMSPEQARGKPLDKRTDIWSFGCVLYECLTGRRPFEGDTTSDTIAKILERDPDVERLPHNTPQTIRNLLHHCLEKDRKRRLRDIGDALVELDEAITTRAWSTPATAASVPSRRWRALELSVFGIAAVLLLVVAVTWALRPGRRTEDLSPSPANATFSKLTDEAGAELSPSLSPDGRTVIYVSRESGNRGIYSLRVGGRNPVNLTHESPDDDTQPAFSPDGESIAFRSKRDGGGIFVMGATGESPRRVTDFGFDPVWSPDGREIVIATEGVISPFSRGTASQLWRVNVGTGEKRLITKGDAVQPHWSPHGHRVAYWTLVAGGQRDIFTIPSEGGEPVPVTRDPATDWNPVWSPDGNYLYFSSDRGGSMNLWRVRIDEPAGRVFGEPEAVTSGVSAAAHSLCFSGSGRRIAYVSTVTRSNIQKIAFDPAAGKIEGAPLWITRGSGLAAHPDPSPDGQWVTYASKGKQEDVFIIKDDGARRRQLTDDFHKDRGPQWSPDGERIAFYSDRNGSYEIWTIKPDGSGLEQLTDTPGHSTWYPVWAPDGSRLVFCDQPDEGGLDQIIMDVGKPWEQQTVTALPAYGGPEEFFVVRSWSPDGSKLAAYIEIANVASGIAIYSLASQKFHRLTDFGTAPVWLSDSRRLLFMHEDKLFLLDGETGEYRELLCIDPHTFGDGLGVQRDDRWIYFARVTTEADIWLMDME